MSVMGVALGENMSQLIPLIAKAVTCHINAATILHSSAASRRHGHKVTKQMTRNNATFTEVWRDGAAGDESGDGNMIVHHGGGRGGGGWRKRQQTRRMFTKSTQSKTSQLLSCILWSDADVGNHSLPEKVVNRLHHDVSCSRFNIHHTTKDNNANNNNQADDEVNIHYSGPSSTTNTSTAAHNNDVTFLHLSDKRVLGVLHEDKEHDIEWMAHTHTAPKLAQALREREETLRILAGLLHPDETTEHSGSGIEDGVVVAGGEIEDALNRVLHPFLPNNILERRRSGPEAAMSLNLVAMI